METAQAFENFLDSIGNDVWKKIDGKYQWVAVRHKANLAVLSIVYLLDKTHPLEFEKHLGKKSIKFLDKKTSKVNTATHKLNARQRLHLIILYYIFYLEMHSEIPFNKIKTIKLMGTNFFKDLYRFNDQELKQIYNHVKSNAVS
jgi:hypothetical protein